MNDTCICENTPTVWRLTGVTRTLRLRIFNPDGTPLDLSGRTVAVTIARDNSEFSYAPGFVIEGDDHNVVKFEWPADKQGAGDYTINVTTTDGSGNVDRVNWHGPTGIRLVDFSFMVRGEDALGVTSEANIGLDGTFTMNGTGMSAYDEWLAEGHTGTPEDFIAWLRQPAVDAATEAAATVAAKMAEVDADMATIEATAAADHTRAGNDHTTASSDHTRAGNDHTLAVADHETAGADHTQAVADAAAAASDREKAATDRTKAAQDRTQAASDHQQASADHGVARADHSTAQGDHTRAGQDHAQAVADSEQAASDHTRAGGDHDIAVADHQQAEADHTQAASDHTTAAGDHTTAAADHTQAVADHAVMAGYDTRLGDVEDEVSQLGQKVDDLATGKYYGYFASASELPDDADVDGFAYIGSGPTYTIYNLRGGIWTSSDITVNQSPIGNDEDIDQDSNGKLQFANRAYDSQNPDGMGYKILRKNATFASQVTDGNTIYEIRYDFVLEENFTMPDNCAIKFNGGSISGGHLLALGKTLCFGAKGLLCPITSVYPVRTSVCGIGDQWEEDSSGRLTSLVNNDVKIIVDTNIVCLNAVISNAKPFYIVGDYSNGYRRPAYSVSFPNSDGFVLSSGQEGATNAISWGHCFRNLNIVSDGDCINFWPENHIAVFAENTFENLYLRSENGDCITFGENYSAQYNTAGFNQYFRQIQAVANNGACFRGISSTTLKFQHITIYGSKDGGFYNCAGEFESVIFDQAAAANSTYGWRWVNKPMSGGVVHFKLCSFEYLKIAIDADGSFNGSFSFESFYSDVRNTWDDPGDGKKHYNHYSFGNVREITNNSIEGGVYGGEFASGFALYASIQAPTLLGKPIDIKVGNPVAKVSGTLPDKAISSFYNQLESGKNYIQKFRGASYTRLEAETFCLTPLRESANDFTFSSGAINLNGVIGHSIILNNVRTIYGFSGYNPPYVDSANKVFEFFILNKSAGDITLVHLNTVLANGSYCFNNFCESDIVLKPNSIAHCIFNGGQAKGDLVANKWYVDVVDVLPRESSAGSTRPSNPYVGQCFFDSSLSPARPLWYNGSAWVDTTGATV